MLRVDGPQGHTRRQLNEELDRPSEVAILDPGPEFSRWGRWLDAVTTEVLRLHTDREVWREVREMLQQNPKLPGSYFLDMIAISYAESAAIAVRRLTESNRRRDKEGRIRPKPKLVRSVLGLVEDLQDKNHLLTRKRFVRRYPIDMQHAGLADRDYDHLAGKGARVVSKRRLAREIAAMRQAAGPIRRYVNRHIAHHDKKPMRRLPTYTDLNRAIDAIGKSLAMCHLVIRSKGPGRFAATIQHNWRAIFRQPWIAP